MTTGALPAGCPPAGHLPAEGQFFRFCAPKLKPGDVPGPDSWALPLYTKKSAAFQKFDDCEAYSYSIFDSLQTLIDARQLSPWARKKSIARVQLSPEMGRILQTASEVGPGHYDWWPSQNDLIPPAEVVEGSAAT